MKKAAKKISDKEQGPLKQQSEVTKEGRERERQTEREGESLWAYAL